MGKGRAVENKEEPRGNDCKYSARSCGGRWVMRLDINPKMPGSWPTDGTTWAGSGPTEPKMDQYSSKMGQLSSKMGPAPHFLAAAGGSAS